MCLKLFSTSMIGQPSLDGYVAYVRKQVGKIERYETTWGEVKAELDGSGLECMIGDSAPDARVFYTDEASMVKMLPYLTFAADYYVAQLDIDCDDYSMWVAALARMIFKVNGIYQCWGKTPLGFHAFSLFYLPGRYKIWEPNAGYAYAGELFSAGENGYVPMKWK